MINMQNNHVNRMVGTANPASKLNAATVLHCRRLYRNTKTSHAKLGAMYGVSKATMRKALLGITWRDVPPV